MDGLHVFHVFHFAVNLNLNAIEIDLHAVHEKVVLVLLSLAFGDVVNWLSKILVLLATNFGECGTQVIILLDQIV